MLLQWGSAAAISPRRREEVWKRRQKLRAVERSRGREEEKEWEVEMKNQNQQQNPKAEEAGRRIKGERKT